MGLLKKLWKRITKPRCNICGGQRFYGVQTID